jgi:hypothetical protein
MKYIPSSTGSAYLPKILGTYENALHPWIGDVAQGSYRSLYVVGCAEGYYAVGLKRVSPNSEVFAFDINPTARQLCSELAKLNSVTLQVNGEFFPNEWPLDDAMIFVDIEGNEEDLLDPAVFSQLARCDLIIETHDFAFGRGNISRTLRQRFEATHYIESCSATFDESEEKKLSSALGISQDLVHTAANEWRASKNDWLRMISKTNSDHRAAQKS